VKKFLICFIGLIFLSCAPVYEVYLGKEDMHKMMDGKKIISLDTVRTPDGILLHVKYQYLER
jgi:hypothetical protein